MAHFKNQVKENSGRTLLEILTVVTIIGLTSVFSLTLYSKAMVQFRSNDILQEAEKIFATQKEKIGRTKQHKSFSLATESQNKTKYGYDITQPKPKCGGKKIMVGVGQINGGRAIDSATCKNLFKSIQVENSPIKAIYEYGECEPLGISACSDSESIAALDFEFTTEEPMKSSPTPKVDPPSPPSSCNATDILRYDEECMTCNTAKKEWEFNNFDGKCKKCENGILTIKYNKCQTCDSNTGAITDKYDTTCQDCNSSTGAITDKDPLPAGCTSADTCAEGSTFVTEVGEEGTNKFSPECPKDSYVVWNDDDKTGCCQPCPSGKKTKGPNAIGLDQCGTPEEATKGCDDEKPLEDTNGNCYPCEWVRNLKLKSGVDSAKICLDLGKVPRMDEKGFSVLLCPDEAPLRDKDGRCWPCDIHEQVNVEGVEQYCNVCNGSNGHHIRHLSSEIPLYAYKDSLVKPDGKGSYCNFDCPDGQFLGKFTCHSCDEQNPVDMGLYYRYTEANCSVCPNRQFGGYQYCAPKCENTDEIMDSHGKCWPCNTTERLYLGYTRKGDCTSVCPDRIEIDTGSIYCAPACDSTSPLQNQRGSCFSCKSTVWDSSSLKIKESGLPCKSVCSNRDADPYFGNYCMPTSVDGKRMLDTRFTHGDSLPLDQYYHSCDEDAPIEVKTKEAKEKCKDLCPDREILGDYCIKPCDSAKPIRGADGNCYACNDDIVGIYLGEHDTSTDLGYLHRDICNKCSEKRVLVNKNKSNYCVKKCPDSTPLTKSSIATDVKANINDYSLYCTTCDDRQVNIQLADTAGCDKCSNRTLLSSSCYIPCTDTNSIQVYDKCYSCDDPERIYCADNSCRNALNSKCDGTHGTKRIFGKQHPAETDALGQPWDGHYSYSCKNRPLTDNKGYCQACDYRYAVADEAGETLTACPNQRYINGKFSYSCDYADKSSSPTGLGKNPGQCEQCGGKIGQNIVNGKTENYCFF